MKSNLDFLAIAKRLTIQIEQLVVREIAKSVEAEGKILPIQIKTPVAVRNLDTTRASILGTIVPLKIR